MGIAGLIIALIGGFITPMILPIVSLSNLLPGVPADIAIASLEISAILFTLLWHHLFDDYPTAQMVSNQSTRVLTRIAIWGTGGLIWGIIWLKTFKMLPFGANDLGLGYLAAGPLAGQFALIMILAIFNTYFDKWTLVRKVLVTSNNSVNL